MRKTLLATVNEEDKEENSAETQKEIPFESIIKNPSRAAIPTERSKS